MTSLLVGGAIGARALFKYNRKNFFLDQKLRQEREFQEQDMRMEQFALYREDVRDLVGLTVAKMDVYTIGCALLLDRTMVLFAKQHEVLPEGAPDWAVALNALSLASAVSYLLLSLWLAMYASVSAQSFGARLLTQFVRLPYASKEQIARSTAQGTDYEGRSLQEMLRIPIVQDRGPGTRPDPEEEPPQQAASSSRSGRYAATSVAAGSAAAAGSSGVAQPPVEEGGEAEVNTSIDPAALLPTAMLEHIRLYRRVQLNWQAYDAYARVSLFVGTNSLLYCCLYWTLGQFILNQNALFPAIGVALIFACVQLMLSRLDLRLRQREVVGIAFLLAITPVATTLGMLLHQDVQVQGASWKGFAIACCAFLTHFLHALVCGLVLRAAWPDSSSGDRALLPSRFRSTLFLDVFGWLLNPQGPGQGAEDEEEYEDDDDSEEVLLRPGPAQRAAPSDLSRASPPLASSVTVGEATDVGLQQSTLPGGSGFASPQRRRLNSTRSPWRMSAVTGDRRETWQISPSLRDEAVRLLHPQGGAAASLGAAPVGATGARSRGSTGTSDTQERRFGGREAAPLRVMQVVNAPGRVQSSTFLGGRGLPQRVPRRAKAPGETPWRAFCLNTSVILLMWVLSTLWALEKLVGGDFWPIGEDPEHHKPDARLLGEAMALVGCANNPGSGPREPMSMLLRHAKEVALSRPRSLLRFPWPAQDYALRCERGHCLAVFVHRGGRSVVVCRLPRSLHRPRVTLRPCTSLRLAPGAPALRPSALLQCSGARGLRLVSRAADGALIVFERRQHRLLVPTRQLEASHNRGSLGVGDDRLAVFGSMLFSLRRLGVSRSSSAGLDSCDASAGEGGETLLMRWWDLAALPARGSLSFPARGVLGSEQSWRAAFGAFTAHVCKRSDSIDIDWRADTAGRWPWRAASVNRS